MSRSEPHWVHDGYVLWLTSKAGQFKWTMPPDWKLSDTHPALLELAWYLLTRTFGEVPPPQHRRRPGRNIALAFSGGVDSTAALQLLPQELTVPVYHERSYASPPLDQTAAIRFSDSLPRSVRVASDIEKLPRHFGKRDGFYGMGAFGVSAVLLADYLDVGYLANGQILEAVYMAHARHGHGIEFRQPQLADVAERCQASGISLYWPTAGLTEVATSTIVDAGPYDHQACSCLRGTSEQPECLNCYKCFRKRAINGTPIPLNHETRCKLTAEQIPMLPSLLWAHRQRSIDPMLDADDLNQPTGWTECWYPDSIRFVPPEFATHHLQQFQRFGIRHLQDVEHLWTWQSQLNRNPSNMNQTAGI